MRAPIPNFPLRFFVRPPWAHEKRISCLALTGQYGALPRQYRYLVEMPDDSVPLIDPSPFDHPQLVVGSRAMKEVESGDGLFKSRVFWGEYNHPTRRSRYQIVTARRFSRRGRRRRVMLSPIPMENRRKTSPISARV